MYTYGDADSEGDKATEYIKYAIDKGFEIGNHSMNHIKYTTLSQEEWLKEISDCDVCSV